MFKETEIEQKVEREKLFKMQMAFLVLWFVIWGTQRVLESIIIS